ncbi:MAG: PilZ domain-containing protein [Planctomycetota bacterium]
MIEHRVFHRLSVRLPVRYAIAAGQEQVGGEGGTINLSAGGMLLSVQAMPTPMVAELLEGRGEIRVAFALALGEDEIATHCRLVWMQGPKRAGDGFELGLRFLDLPSATHDRIHAFISQMSH